MEVDDVIVEIKSRDTIPDRKNPRRRYQQKTDEQPYGKMVYYFVFASRPPIESIRQVLHSLVAKDVEIYNLSDPFAHVYIANMDISDVLTGSGHQCLYSSTEFPAGFSYACLMCREKDEIDTSGRVIRESRGRTNWIVPAPPKEWIPPLSTTYYSVFTIPTPSYIELRNSSYQTIRDRWCDFEIRADGNVVKAHRNILAISSTFFRDWLGDFPEATSVSIDGQFTKRVVDLFYGGSLQTTDPDYLGVLTSALFYFGIRMSWWKLEWIKASLLLMKITDANRSQFLAFVELVYPEKLPEDYFLFYVRTVASNPGVRPGEALPSAIYRED